MIKYIGWGVGRGAGGIGTPFKNMGGGAKYVLSPPPP